MTKLVDIRQVFDHFGMSMPTREYLERRIADLEARNAELERMLRTQARRMRQQSVAETDEKPTRH